MKSNLKCVKCAWVSLLVLFLVLGFGGNALAEYTGRVTGPEGKPMPGVAVSDGRNVVETDADGNYKLPGWDRAAFVFVSTPAGYRVQGNHFYQSTKQNTQVFNFELEAYPISAADEIRFAQVTDVETPHLTEWIGDLRRVAAEQKCAFVISSGDICYERGMQFNAQNVNTDTIGTSVYYSIGNHDFIKGKKEHFYEDLFGPCWYSFDAGPIHFIVTPIMGGDDSASFSFNDVTRWMKNDIARLPKDREICHINHSTWTSKEPIETEGNFVQGSGDSRFDQREANIKTFIFGHRHNNLVYKSKSGILFAVAAPGCKGGNDHSPANIMVNTFNKQGLQSIDSRETYVNHQVAIIAPKETYSPKKPIRVQIYDTGASVKTATWTLLEEDGGKEVASGKLKQEFDWTWKSVKKKGGKKDGKNASKSSKPMTLKVNVEFTDGEKREASVVLNKKAEGKPILKELWTTNVGGNLFFGSVVPVKDGLLVATGSDNTPELNWMVRLTKKGKIQWKTSLKNAVKSPVVVEGNLAFASDIAWNTYAIDAKTGKIKWSAEQGGARVYMLGNGPAVHKGVLYAGFKDELTAFEAKTGKVLWKNTEWGGGIPTVAPHAIFGDKLLVGANWTGNFAHDLKTGKLAWKTGRDLGYRGSAFVPYPGEKRGEEKVLFTSHTTLAVLDPNNGNKVNSVNGPNMQSASAPLVFGNLILVGANEAGLIAYDLKTLKRLWTFSTGKNLFCAAPYTPLSPNTVYKTIEATPVTLEKKYVVVGALDGFLYVLEPNEKGANVVQKINIGAPIMAAATVDKKCVYVTDFSGNIHAFGF